MRSDTITAAALFALSSSVAAQNGSENASPGLRLTAQLQLADTAVDRYNLFPNDDDFIFDFRETKVGIADRKSFPALVGTNSAMAVAEIPPCGMASLHIHPRSAELFAVVTGRVFTEMVPEAGVVDADGKSRLIRTELGPNQMTVFPMGSFHTQLNPDCEPVITVASFASEDPGAGLVAPQIFTLSDEVAASSFGQAIAGEDIDSIWGTIPPGPLFQVESCLRKCGIEKRK